MRSTWATLLWGAQKRRAPSTESKIGAPLAPSKTGSHKRHGNASLQNHGAAFLVAEFDAILGEAFGMEPDSEEAAEELNGLDGPDEENASVGVNTCTKVHGQGIHHWRPQNLVELDREPPPETTHFEDRWMGMRQIEVNL